MEIFTHSHSLTGHFIFSKCQCKNRCFSQSEIIPHFIAKYVLQAIVNSRVGLTIENWNFSKTYFECIEPRVYCDFCLIKPVEIKPEKGIQIHPNNLATNENESRIFVKINKKVTRKLIGKHKRNETKAQKNGELNLPPPQVVEHKDIGAISHWYIGCEHVDPLPPQTPHASTFFDEPIRKSQPTR